MTIKVSKEELYKLYWEKEYSLIKISKIFNCSWHTIENRFKKFGIKLRTIKEASNTNRFKENCKARMTGKNHPNWKGGIIRNNEGYILIWQPDHPRANIIGYVKRARLVAEKKLDRFLYDDEIPHHKNEIKDDDRPENIKIMTEFNHKSFHMKNRKK